MGLVIPESTVISIHGHRPRAEAEIIPFLFSLREKPASYSRRPPEWVFLGEVSPRPDPVQAFEAERFNFISSPKGDRALGHQPSKLLIDKQDQQFINLRWQPRLLTSL